MVTKIKPRRIKSDNPGSLGDFLGYQDEANFLWGEGGGRYTAGEGIAILDGLDYSAMRGPCDEGFHVPMRSEGNALCNILTNTFGFVNQSSTLETYVKMPMAGKLSSSDASYFGVGQHGYYRTCETLTDYAYYMYGGPLTIGCDSATSRSSGNSIRQFKDTPVIPDGGSTWTTIYDGSSIATGAGIFHNTTSGIISLSGDGINWITIADKNLGATQVYNNGDTLSESNCGKYYQWGNNYGFDGIGGSTPTTSATKVDASSYGPGNFYSSSTYITTSASPYDWSSVQNNNLRGGVTGVQEYHNAITNTGVLSVNGETGHVTIDGGNTKAFFLSNTYDTTTAQAAYDWSLAGKNPIIMWNGGAYILSEHDLPNSQPALLVFREGLRKHNAVWDNKYTVNTSGTVIRLLGSNDTVSSISIIENTDGTNGFLSPGIDYTNPYVPEYNGSPATKKYVDEWASAGEGIAILNGPSYSAMRGPCNEGYHIPTSAERGNIVDIWTALGGLDTDGSGFCAALKLPKGGIRYGNSGNAMAQGEFVYYWSCSPYTSDTAYHLRFTTQSITYNIGANRYEGFNIRPFKDTPVIPTSSWVKLYGVSIVAGGIFRDSINGFISLSDDGTDWVTIADKNVGAIIAWNSGDVVNQNNCGNYYQRGNVYGFPFTGSVTTSSTKVDASGYGPGNYYNSSTWITAGDDRSSVQNDDLWGGVTGIIQQRNAITNTGVLSVNGQTGHVLADENVYCTQAEYNALLPGASTDGKNYIIYDTNYTPEEKDVVPVYYYHGTFSSNITFNVLSPGDYKITINGYHGGSINRTITINADGTDVASYTSTVIEMFSFMTVAHATSSLVISISSDSLFTIHDVYIEKIIVQPGYLTAVVN